MASTAMGLYSRVMRTFTPNTGMRKSPPYLTVCSLVQSGKEKQDGERDKEKVAGQTGEGSEDLKSTEAQKL